MRLHSLASLVSVPRPDWVLPGAARRGEVAVIHGAPGCGKSTLMIDVACSLAGGIRHDLGSAAFRRAQRVVVVAGEGGGADFVERAHAWVESRPERSEVADVVGSHLFVVPHPLDVSDALLRGKLREEVLRALGGTVPDVVVVDTVSACATSIDENSSTDVAGLISAFRRLFATPTTEDPAPGPLWLLVHHQPKGSNGGPGTPRGSGAWKGNVDLELEVTRDGSELTVTQRKGNRIAGLDETLFELRSHDFGHVDEFGIRGTAPFTVSTEPRAEVGGVKTDREATCCTAFRRILAETFLEDDPPTTRSFRKYLQDHRKELGVSGKDWDRYHKAAIDGGFVLREEVGRSKRLRPGPTPAPLEPHRHRTVHPPTVTGA